MSWLATVKTMTLRRFAPLALVPAAFALAACGGTPTATPTTDAPAGPDTCDETVFTDNVDAELEVTSTPLPDLAFPMDSLEGLDISCTARLSVVYTDVEQTVEFDIAVVDESIDDVSTSIGTSIASKDWVQDDDNTIWRDPEDQNVYIEALQIDDGILVGATEAG